MIRFSLNLARIAHRASLHRPEAVLNNAAIISRSACLVSQVSLFHSLCRRRGVRQALFASWHRWR
ncbi:MAG TPA: hypothetical protein DGH25_09040 [Erwiniaceae bacterium]|nr:hypothetical protein PSNIH2_17650 [Pantoea sp. PSNIH2]POU46716.1 hypothetical protein C3380_14625 [Pantoea sp. PSNIH5]POU67298.1 hypothetical protein C3374_10420 [Pantoea sp. PSNIH4]POY67581.1 hypothetical protein C3402_11865 [Pantoea sp. PSNIH3]HCW47502.1 hypothetical protein [Erwiniaceae bacterium]